MTSHNGSSCGATGTPLIVALVYEDDSLPEAQFAAMVDWFRARGFRLAGLLQRSGPSLFDRRCDVELEDLASGKSTQLLERRGANARGCRLDHAALSEATRDAILSLAEAPDLLFVNKFGKAECEGGGTRDLIAAAVLQGVRVVIGVPARNLPAWRNFVGFDVIEEPLHQDSESQPSVLRTMTAAAYDRFRLFIDWKNDKHCVANNFWHLSASIPQRRGQALKRVVKHINCSPAGRAIADGRESAEIGKPYDGIEAGRGAAHHGSCMDSPAGVVTKLGAQKI